MMIRLLREFKRNEIQKTKTMNVSKTKKTDKPLDSRRHLRTSYYKRSSECVQIFEYN